MVWIFLFKNHFKKIVFFLCVILSFLFCILWKGDRSSPIDPSKKPVSVVVAPVLEGDMTVTRTTLGTVTPRNVVTIRARVEGQLTHVSFKEGQEVKEGQLLAQIDPRPYEAALKQAEGALERDQALLRNAILDCKRYHALKKQDSISLQTHDTQKALVEQYKGLVRADQGKVNAAQIQLDFTRITSPLDGRIGLRLVDPGNIVHVSDPDGMFVITQTRPTTVVFALAQGQLPLFYPFLHHAQKIPVEAWDSRMTMKLGTGCLDSIDNQIDRATGTFKLKALFSNHDGTLFANQFVNVKVILESRKDVTTMPLSAVQRGTQGTFVYRLNDNSTVSVIPVKLGPADDQRVQIESGIILGDQVVIDGADKLREGSVVRVGHALEAKTSQNQNKSQSSSTHP